MRWIYLSPHLDDAVLSAGGLIHEQTRQGMHAEIWSCMCGVPAEEGLTDFAKVLHQVWGFSSGEEAIRLRREEDLRAAALVGAGTRHFEFLDCIYRLGNNGEALYTDVFVPPHPDDRHLPAQIAQALVAWLKPDDVVVCQLGIGRHVDHVLVRKAVEMLRRPLVYDADIPYLISHPEELAPLVNGMVDAVHEVPPEGFKVWLEAIRAYRSQISSLFSSDDDLEQKMRGYWDENKGVRLWKFD